MKPQVSARFLCLALYEISHLILAVTAVLAATLADILFDFRVDVAPSRIPNAGMGAFLTFLGARHRKVEADRKTAGKINHQQNVFPDHLEAMGDDGFGIHVKLAGEVVNEGKAERPKGIGPNHIFEESDFEEEPSPTTEFSRHGEGNGLIRKCFKRLSYARSLLWTPTFNIRLTAKLRITRPRPLRTFQKDRSKAYVTFRGEKFHLRPRTI